MRKVLIVLTALGTAAVLAGCGPHGGDIAGAGQSSTPPVQAGSAGAAEVTASPTASAQGASAASGAPSGAYIAVCNGDTIFFLDPANASVISQESLDMVRDAANLKQPTGPDGNRGSFSVSGNFDQCESLPLNGDLTRSAGIDHYGVNGVPGDAVPAYADIATGQVTDVVAPRSHSGFDKSSTYDYVAARYDPVNDDFWSAQLLWPDEEHLNLFGPNGVKQAWTCIAGELTTFGMFFQYGSNQPAIDSSLGNCQQGSSVDDDASQPEQAGWTLDRSILPATDYVVGTILRSDDGKSAAFVAYSPGTTNGYLFTVPVSGGEPTKIGAVPPQVGDTILQVVRYKN